MQTNPRPFTAVMILIALTLLGSGCSAEAKKTRHLQSADTHYAAGDYDKAEVEYLNVLKLEQLNGPAIGKLGMIYSAQGRLNRAIAYLMKGRELMPEDLDLRLKAGQLYLATGKPAEARKEAEYILTRKPQDTEAPELLTATLTKPEEADTLRKRLLALPPPAPTGAPVLVALAGLELRLGHLPEAEAAVQKAKLANPANASVYSLLATIQLMQKNLPAAMQSFQQAAALSPPRSPRLLQYAQFKLRTGDLAGARELMLDITRKTPDYIPAWIALADLSLTQNKIPDCTEMLAKALGRDPQNVEGLIIQGRVYNLKGEYDKAIALFEKMAVSYPRVSILHQELGRAYALTGDINKGMTSLNQAISLAPNAVEATLLLAQLDMRKGDFNAAIALLRKQTAQYPNLAQAQLMLADAYRAQGSLDEALAIYRQLEQQAPKNSETPLLRGLVLAQQGKVDEARSAFEAAFVLAPDSPTPLEQLVNLQLRDKKYQPATTRVEAAVAQNPKLAGYGQLLLAKIALAQGDNTQAEIHLNKNIELMPDSPTAYFLLAGIYARSNQQAKALSQLNEVLKHDPKQATALMLSSVIQDGLGNYAAARDGYEKLLVLNPRSPVALNNLAYLYSERFNDLDKALDLAQKVRQLAPTDPSAADTLGWILYRKRQYQRGLTFLTEAAEKKPEDGEMQFHLGLTHYMMGEEKAARTALQRAVELMPEAKWQGEARQALSILAMESGQVGPALRAALDKALKERPDDPVAMTRLAALLESEGKPDQAITSLENAFKSNPLNVKVLTNLARLHGAARHSAQALEYAKAARKLSPDDPEVTQFLGRLAFQNGDYQWAFSLLQEASQKQQNSPDLLFDLALAGYSVGHVTEADSAAHDALSLAKTQSLVPFNRADEARQFLALLELAENPDQATKQATLVEQVLKADPASVPGLMAAARISEQRNAPDAARQNYEKALARYPDFMPAKLRLAVLAASLTIFDQKSYDWAMQARTAYPTDALLAKTLGIQSFLKNDLTRSLALLKESLAARDNDAVTQYYLGLAQSKLKDAGATKSLQRALDLGLTGEALLEAKKIIAEQKK